MSGVLSILNELAATASTKEKESIIRREKDNAILKLVFQAAYNPMITYGIKQIPEYTTMFSNPTPLDIAIQYLNDDFVSRKLTGNAAIDGLRMLLSDMLSDDAIVLGRIIDRDLRCGTSDSIASRVWKGLVPVHDVMLSHKDISGIKYPAYAQIKSDGARCHLYFDGKHAVATSRTGKTILLHGVLDNDIAMLIEAGETIDGELLCYVDGIVLDRKTGNGIVNKAIKGTISVEEAQLIRFASWDIVDFTSTIPYSTRIKRLTDKLLNVDQSKFEHRIDVLSTEIVNSEEEAKTFYEKCIDAGEEGAMIKNIGHVWEPKRSKNIGKMKGEEVADLMIRSWYYGKAGKKFENALGGFRCVTSDGLLEVDVGGGYSDEFRLQDTAVFDKMVNSIIAVTYNMTISDRTSGMNSLFLPRVDSKTEWIRVDKFVANTFAELK